MAKKDLNYLIICRRIKKLAREAEVSKSVLASKSGVSPRTIWSIWSERHRPSEGTLLKLASFFNVSYETLVYGQTAAAEMRGEIGASPPPSVVKEEAAAYHVKKLAESTGIDEKALYQFVLSTMLAREQGGKGADDES